ncbi:MAG: hypothetical protein GTO55_11305 [Armatimonadetes bacterium]|nr:hypothetical protein [Armatimonadota bacterium]NIM24803.1 hypothetical protein [Armatimonadota bacterium]NIM68694.1 hypothetical protein [Armatimonadota bacterium]NIM76989.1 hypothetical protein [Armatimonadota bacterium]NIN06895.1 hypothetical protein [Armatimonadota bacterium]
MADPTSVRYLPIREAVCSLLADYAALVEVKEIARDEEAFVNLPGTCFPALGVFFAQNAGEEVAQWASRRRDHRYWLEVRVAVRSLESARACEDLLFSYVEAVEDALRSDATLGGLVRDMSAGLVQRSRRKAGDYWHSEAAFLVMCEKSVN